MKIYHKNDAINVSKPEGTNVTYFLFDEYEVHYNEQIPNTTQTWHHHEKIWETLYVIEGELEANWREGGVEKTEIVKSGDLIESENSPHTFTNKTENIVKFLVIKRLNKGENLREILKSDKVLD